MKTTTLLTALAAAFGYGGWAVYANHEYGLHVSIMAGIVQGTYAFFSTFSITHVAHKVYLKYHCKIRGIIAGFLMSFIIMLAIPLTVHSILGTPNLWKTITPGLIWGSIYLAGFLIFTERKRMKVDASFDKSKIKS